MPAGSDVKSWDGSGAVWFRVSTTMPSVDAQKKMSWPGQSVFSQSLLSCLGLCVCLLVYLSKEDRSGLVCVNTHA